MKRYSQWCNVFRYSYQWMHEYEAVMCRLNLWNSSMKEHREFWPLNRDQHCWKLFIDTPYQGFRLIDIVGLNAPWIWPLVHCQEGHRKWTSPRLGRYDILNRSSYTKIVIVHVGRGLQEDLTMPWLTQIGRNSEIYPSFCCVLPHWQSDDPKIFIVIDASRIALFREFLPLDHSVVEIIWSSAHDMKDTKPWYDFEITKY